MAINIRLLKDEEYPEMLKLMYRVFPNSNIKIDHGDRIIIADMYGQIVGFVHYAYYRDKAVIKGFGVEGNVRGIGIGTGLIESVIKKFESVAKPVYLKVKDLNPANNIYARFGFVLARYNEAKGIYLLVKRVNN